MVQKERHTAWYLIADGKIRTIDRHHDCHPLIGGRSQQ